MTNSPRLAPLYVLQYIQTNVLSKVPIIHVKLMIAGSCEVRMRIWFERVYTHFGSILRLTYGSFLHLMCLGTRSPDAVKY